MCIGNLKKDCSQYRECSCSFTCVNPRRLVFPNVMWPVGTTPSPRKLPVASGCVNQLVEISCTIEKENGKEIAPKNYRLLLSDKHPVAFASMLNDSTSF